jgi:hypothetical protein
MEVISRAFLKEQKETMTSSAIPEHGDEVSSKLFDAANKVEAPKMMLPPPYPYPGTPPGSFSVLTTKIHKLSFPTFNGKEHPLSWLNCCEQLFRGQKTPKTGQVWYASYPLTRGANNGTYVSCRIGQWRIGHILPDVSTSASALLPAIICLGTWHPYGRPVALMTTHSVSRHTSLVPRPSMSKNR